MKKIVWENKSNNQLCITIPKGSGINAGDIVNLEKEKIKKLVYSATTADLFNYGQLRLLDFANKSGDFHICGVLTDKAISSYKKGPIANFEERKAIISSLRCVDMVLTQDSLEPTENLKKIHEQFPYAKILLVGGSNWKKIPGEDYIKKIKGEIIKFPFYEKLSPDKLIKKIIETYGK